MSERSGEVKPKAPLISPPAPNFRPTPEKRSVNPDQRRKRRGKEDQRPDGRGRTGEELDRYV
ncbi:MAG: hypothetical protein AB1641_30090 [Thermodesulfobacteriota bacterium]